MINTMMRYPHVFMFFSKRCFKLAYRRFSHEKSYDSLGTASAAKKLPGPSRTRRRQSGLCANLTDTQILSQFGGKESFPIRPSTILTWSYAM